MITKRDTLRLAAAGFLSLLALSACSTPPPEVTPDINTRVAMTLEALATPVTPSPTSMPTPTETRTPTSTEEPTETPTPSLTPTQTATGTARPTETATAPPGTPATAGPLGQRIFFDDFSSGQGWYVNQGENSAFEFVDGGYQITNNLVGAQFWSVREMPADIIQEVDARRKAGPASGYFGVVCRHQEDGKNYYALVIGSDGFYGIAIMEDGTFSFLIQGLDEKNIINKQEGAFNRVRAECVGDRLSLYANERYLAEVRNTAFESGRLGPLNGTKLEPGLVVLFDNYGVYQP